MSAGRIANALLRYEELVASGEHEAAAKVANDIVGELCVAEGDENPIITNSIAASQIVASTPTWFNLGNALYDLGRYDRARVCYLHGLQIARAAEGVWMAKLCHAIANTHFMEGDYELARRYYEDSARRCEEQNLSAGTADNLTQLSEISKSFGQYNESEEMGRLSLEINVREARVDGIIRSVQCLCNLAIQLYATGCEARAKDLLAFCTESLQPSRHEIALDIVRRTLEGFEPG